MDASYDMGNVVRTVRMSMCSRLRVDAKSGVG